MIIHTDSIPPQVSGTLLKTLGCLSTPDGPCTPTRLAEAVGITAAAMTGVIDAGEERGWLARRPKPGDRRQIIVGLTEAGKEAVEAMMWRDGQEAAA